MPSRVSLAGAGAALLLLIPLHARPRLVWNASASAPVGLYAVDAPRALRAGDLVIAAPPPAAARLAANRHYLPLGVPLVKRIAALPGEPVCAAGATLRAPRGLSVERLRADARGHLLPWWKGCGRLGADTYLLLMADVRDSFDGRYFGPVARAQIVGKARALWLP